MKISRHVFIPALAGMCLCAIGEGGYLVLRDPPAGANASALAAAVPPASEAERTQEGVTTGQAVPTDNAAPGPAPGPAGSSIFLPPSSGVVTSEVRDANGQVAFVISIRPGPMAMSLEQLEAEHEALSASVPALFAKGAQLRQTYHINDFAPDLQVCMPGPAASKEVQQLDEQIRQRQAAVAEIQAKIVRSREYLPLTAEEKESILVAQKSKLASEQSALSLLQTQRASMKDPLQGFLEYANTKNAYISDKARLAEVEARLKELRARLEPIPPERVRDWRHPPALAFCKASP